MSYDDKDYRVRITVKNNRILRAIEEAGFRGWGSITAFAKHAEMNASFLAGFLSFRISPLGDDGEFRKDAKLLMEALGCAPSDLWSEEQMLLAPLKRNWREAAVSLRDLRPLLEDYSVDRLTVSAPEDGLGNQAAVMQAFEESGLSKRQIMVLCLRLGIGCDELTLEEVGERIGVTRERVRQIEIQALREMRQQHRKTKHLVKLGAPA